MLPKPRPVPDEQSAGYWSAAAEHVLALARCSRCGGVSMPPGPVCPYCRSTDPAFEFVPVDGRGTIRSWTLIRDAFLPGFGDEVPYVLVDVALDDHPDVRMIGRLVDGPDAPLASRRRRHRDLRRPRRRRRRPAPFAAGKMSR